jgi:hypothetical protein
MQTSIWRLNELGSALNRLGRRYQQWRMLRLYARVIRMEQEATLAMYQANALHRKYGDDPQTRLPFGD